MASTDASIEYSRHSAELPTQAAMAERQKLDWVVMLAITVMPITWIPLIEAGFISLEFRHFAGFVVIGMTGLSMPAIRDAIVHFKAPWISLAMILYILILLFSMFHARPYGGALGIRSLFWVIVAWLIYARMPTARTVHLAAISGFVAFVGAVEYSAYQSGQSLFEAMFNFFTTGDFFTFRYRFIPSVMSAFGAPTDDVESGSSPNSFASVALHIFVLYLASRGGVSRYRLRWLVDVAVLGMTAAIVFAVLSRAVVLMMVIAVVVAAAIALTRRRAWVVMVIGILAVMYLAAFVIAGSDLPFFNTLEDRLFEDKGSFFARLNQWDYAFALIQQKPWTGDGVYKLDNAMDIHNLFLGAFVGGGIFTFLFACAYYLSIVLPWMRMVIASILGASPGNGWNVLFVPAILVVGLVRPMLGGGLGELAGDGWIMVAIAMSVIHRFQYNSAPAGGAAQMPHRQ